MTKTEVSPEYQTSASPRRKATILDVASAAGVSYATVSRYLNGNPHVSGKAAERIASAIQAVNYIPNKAAQSLVRRRTQTVAFVIHGLPNAITEDPNIMPILLSANRTLSSAGYQLVTLLSDSPHAQERIIHLASGGFADGWIINTYRKGDPFFEALERINVPIAVSGVGYGASTPFPAVDIDNESASYNLTQHVRQRGRRRIAYICGPSSLPCSDTRLRGFRNAMGPDYDPSLVVRARDWTKDDGRDALLRLGPDLSQRADALICASDCLAAGAMHHLISAGVRIPDDLAVAGFDDGFDALATHPQLTTVHQPLADYGVALSTMILNQIENHTFERTVLLPTSLVTRASTGE